MKTHRSNAPSANAASPDRATSVERTLDERTLREFIHELANLVDGSMRSIELARRELDAANTPSAPGGRAADGEAHHRIETAIAGLTHVAGLIRSVAGHLQGLEVLRAPGLLDQPRPLREAISHAIDLLEPLAHSRGIRIELDVDDDCDAWGPTALYPVLANALRNAIDAINSDGAILVRIRPGAGGALDIEILDDGIGPPAMANGASVFDFGFSSKPGSSGIGLSLARDLVAELGGTIDLLPRWPEREGRRGARLIVRIPEPSEGPR